MAKEKAKANRILGHALEWWNAHAAALAARPLTPSGDSPVSVAWQAPLYRVRIGPFASRAQADSVLGAVQSTFPGAFVRPGHAGPQQ
jgi:hypothetical protein